jgi:hypothetical protein
MKLTKINISKAELLSISKKELELFIQLTNFYNDVNILQKLMVISGNSREKASQNEIVGRSLSSQGLFFMRIQAGKLYEGWKMLGIHFFNNEIFSKEYHKKGSPQSKKNLFKLKKYFGKNNLIENIRNNYAFHYSKESSNNMVKQIINAPDLEIFEIYLSKEYGNCFYSIAHDLLNSSILKEIDSCDQAKAMDDFFQQIMDITKQFLDFTQDCIRVISEKYLQLNCEEVQIPEPPMLDDITLPFFVRR